MAESFNLQNVLSSQSEYVSRKYTASENAKAAMEQRELQAAQKAIESEQGFLSLSVS